MKEEKKGEPARPLRSILDQIHAGEKASFLPWWGQKIPAGAVGSGTQGWPAVGLAWAPLRWVPCTHDSRPWDA